MPTITLDAKTRVIWVAGLDGIADITAPTVAEATAGLVLSKKITPDGLTVTPTTGNIDNSNLGSTFTTNQVGRRSFTSSVKLQRQTVTADAIATALSYGEEGYLMISKGYGVDAALAAGQTWKVYPMQCGEPSEPVSAPEQLWTYEVPLMITDDPVTMPEAIMAA